MSTLSTTSGEKTFLSFLNEAPKSREKRRSLRTPAGSLASVRQVVNAAELNPIHALVIDVSEGGLGLRCPLGLVRARSIALKLMMGPSPTPRTSKSSVRADGAMDRTISERGM